MERPGGGPFRLDVCGPSFAEAKPGVSTMRGVDSGPSFVDNGLVDPFCLASMSCLCWSLTLKLRCNCSRNAGSCVWKPGDRQATPKSLMCRPAESFDVSGTAPAV